MAYLVFMNQVVVGVFIIKIAKSTVIYGRNNITICLFMPSARATYNPA